MGHLIATRLANVVAMVLNEEVTNCPLRLHDTGGPTRLQGLSLATMKDLSARLEPTRPQQDTSPRVRKSLRWTLLRST